MAETAILLTTCSGEAYIEELLASLDGQTLQDFVCYIHDDGSTDRTPELVRAFAEKRERFVIVEGPPSGSASANFLFLMHHVQDEKYVMFCDQDDVWKPEKAERTLREMKRHDDGQTPAVVFTDLTVTDAGLRVIAPSYLAYEHRDPAAVDLPHLLKRNVAPGCTMLMNRSLLELSLAHEELLKRAMFDWGVMLLASACGSVFFLNRQTLFYRQHGNNEVGARKRSGRHYALHEFREIVSGKKAQYIRENLELARDFARLLLEAAEEGNPNRPFLEELAGIEKKGKGSRMRFYLRSGLIDKNIRKIWRVLFV